MKRLFGYVAVAAAVASLFACSPKGKCVISGVVTYPQYETIYMFDLTGEMVDSVSRAEDGTFRMVYDKKENMPQVVLLEFNNPYSPADRMHLPVALEPGKVEVNVGMYIKTGGTPLNDEIMDFFDGLQALQDEYRQNVATVDQKLAAYSAFYRDVMRENSDNVFGAYVTLAYGRELLPEDLELLMKEASESAE